MFSSGDRPQRGQSELIGIVLLFALVITVSLTVVVVGSSAISDVKSNTMTESAEVTMLELQSAAAKGGSSRAAEEEISFVQSASARPAGEYADGVGSRAENAGKISIDETSGEIVVEVKHSGGTLTRTITMGTFVYQRDGETIAYQGGGVFRKNADGVGSTIVSPPNFQYQYRNGVPTLSMPVTSMSGDISDADFTLQQKSSSRLFPTSSAANPIKAGNKVTITVESDYFRSWADLFRQRTDGTVDTGDFNGDGDANEARLILTGPPDTSTPGPLSSGLTSLGGVSISNNGQIDSYTPEPSGYTGSFINRYKGDVVISGSANINNNPHIAGELRIGGTLTASNNWVVERRTVIGGDADWDNNPELKGGLTVHGDANIGGGNMELGDSLIVGGNLNELNAKGLDGSIYVHGGLPNTYQPLDVDNKIRGSLHVGGDAELEGRGGGNKLDITIRDDLIVGGSLDISDNVEFDTPSQIESGESVTVSGNVTGDIVAADSVTIQSGVTVTGDVDAGIDVNNYGHVTGDIVAGDDITGSGSSGGSETQNGSPESPSSPTLPTLQSPDIPPLEPAEDSIDAMRHYDDSPSNNDNDQINDNNLENGGCPCTIGPGNYALDELDPGGKVTINTNGEPVNIYVKPSGASSGKFTLDYEFDVKGEGRVQIALDGGDVQIGNNANVHVPKDDASQFWIYTMPSAQVTDAGGTPTITGVLYGAAPGGGTSMSLSSNFEWYGAIVGDTGSISNNPTIHFDETLTSSGTGGGTDLANPSEHVGYLQIRTIELEISD